jgi:hypothetical protein
MASIVFTKIVWPIISDEKYLMVDDACQLAIETQDHQQAVAGAPVDVSSVCHLPGCLSLQISPQTREAESVNSVFNFLIGLMTMLNTKKIYSGNSRLAPFKSVWQMELLEQLSEVTSQI